MKEKSDAELMKLVNNKHRPALEELYDRYIKLVYSFVFKFSNSDEEQTKEMVQLVFLKLWTTKSHYDPSKGSFVNWLLTIVRNVCIDYIRKEKIHTQVKHRSFETESQVALVDPVNQIQEMITGSEIASAKSKLSPSQKRLIDMLYWRGYTLAEIARIENEPVGTIKSRLYQSLKQLKKYLEMEGS